MSLTRKHYFLLVAIGLLVFAVGALLLSLSSLPWEKERLPPTSATNQTNALEPREAEADRTVWAAEMQAENCGLTFEKLWD